MSKKMRTRLLSPVLFLVAFAATSALVGRLTGEPELGDLSRKLRAFEAGKDGYEVLFLGSSRVQRGVDPLLFDAELARRGIELRSFNLGVAGMKPHAANFLLREVLAAQPARLRFVVVEIDGWDPDLPAVNRYGRRAIHWHDGAETLSALRSTLAADKPWPARVELAVQHLLHLGARLTAAGRGPDAVGNLLEPADRTVPELPSRGFKAFPVAPLDEPSHHPFRQRFQREQASYRRAVTELADGPPRGPAGIPDFRLAALSAQAKLLRQAGIEPVYLLPPIPRPSPEVDLLARRGAIPNLLAFNRPDLFPELFEVEQRFDHEHLNRHGAEAFTRHLARRFEEEVWERSPSPLQTAAGGG